ncbi:LysR family transcriptional regulator [Bdellovibrio sp. HCB2-146]|uniref:LysR family transcriptional regulator n=1 Tax=Bdellovibrio sp. HCB2-146 TaxID=3394362 RepID=UPI0039BC5387
MKTNAAQLEAFYTVAKLSNFTRAAEALHVTQSALSQRIAKLEEDLETTLFIRDRTSIRLTEAGEQVLRFCQLNDQAESELIARLKGSKTEVAGVIRIGGFSSVNRSLVIPALRKLMVKNPMLSVELMTKELHDLFDLLRRTEVDYILTNTKSQTADIENVFLGYEDNVLVTSKKHTDNNIFLDHDENDSTTKGYFTQNKMSFKPTTMRYLDDVYGLIDGVKNGYGKAVLPLHLIENEKDLEIIEPKKKLVVPVYLQFYVQPYYRSIHTLITENLKEYFAENLRQS